MNPHGYEDGEEGEEGFAENLDEKNLSDDEAEGTRILRAMSFARQLALSPYLYACNPEKRPTYEQYVETSPKLKYVMDCIKSVKQYHEERDEPVSGQVIYMNAGVHYFPLLKDYLVHKVGYKESEVGIIKGGISVSKKEGIKERFLAGDVKIIIGSDTIKEGINLQERSTVLYNCWLNFNPTDQKQLEGRIFRFGNIYANVRIVDPLMEDSIDIFMFQKLEEKTSRINEIWFRSGKTNALSLEEFNPGELKMGLVTDPHALAGLMMMEEKERLQDELNGLRNQKEVLKTLDEQRAIYNTNFPHVKKTADKYSPSKEAGKARTIETLFKIYRDYLEDENSGSSYLDENTFDKVRKAYAAVQRGIEQVLQPRGLDINFKLESVTKNLDKEIDVKQKYMDETTGDKGINAKAEEIIADRVKKGYKPKTVAERVKEFASLNPKLLSERMVYDGSDAAKAKQAEQKKKGQALEGTADRLTKIIELRESFKRMKNRLEKVRELRNAA
ncbi:MAG: hypothetical protein HYU69_11915 [Bacteroidetes bacterium]|nr:hypothetical protein [Bacteroidota bacterium]